VVSRLFQQRLEGVSPVGTIAVEVGIESLLAKCPGLVSRTGMVLLLACVLLSLSNNDLRLLRLAEGVLLIPSASTSTGSGTGGLRPPIPLLGGKQF
jgi:hypothetical protein